MQHTVRKADEGHLGVRALATVAYGAARSSLGKSLGVLYTVIAEATAQRLDKFNAQCLSNTAWALTDSAACTLGSC